MRLISIISFFLITVIFYSGCGGGNGGNNIPLKANITVNATLSELPLEIRSSTDVKEIAVTISAPGQSPTTLNLVKVNDTFWSASLKDVVAVPKVQFHAVAYHYMDKLYEGTVTQDIVANTNNTINIVMGNLRPKTTVNITATVEDSSDAIRDATDIASVWVDIRGENMNNEWRIPLTKISGKTWTGSVEIIAGTARQFTFSAQESTIDDSGYLIFQGIVTQDVVYGVVNNVVIPAVLVFPPKSSVTLPKMTGVDPEVGEYFFQYADMPGRIFVFIFVTQDPVTGIKYAHYSGDAGRSYDKTKIVHGVFYNIHCDSWYGYTLSGWFTTPTHVEGDVDGFHHSADLNLSLSNVDGGSK